MKGVSQGFGLSHKMDAIHRDKERRSKSRSEDEVVRLNSGHIEFKWLELEDNGSLEDLMMCQG